MPPRAAALRRAVALVGRTHPRAVAVGAELAPACRTGHSPRRGHAARLRRRPPPSSERGPGRRTSGSRTAAAVAVEGGMRDHAMVMERTVLVVLEACLHPYACRYLLLGAPMMADGACADARVPGVVNDASYHQEVAFPNAKMTWRGYVVVAELGALPPTVPTRRLALRPRERGFASPGRRTPHAVTPDARSAAARLGASAPTRRPCRSRTATADADALRSLPALSASSNTGACRGRPPPPRHPLPCECQLLSRPGEHLVPLRPLFSSSCNFPQIPKPSFPDGLVPFDPHWFLIDFLI